MKRIDPRIAGLTPTVAARSQKTISGPNSASAKRAAAISLDMGPPASGAGFDHRGEHSLDRLAPIDDSHVVDAGNDRQRDAERRQRALIAFRVHQLVIRAGDDRDAALGPLKGAFP